MNEKLKEDSKEDLKDSKEMKEQELLKKIAYHEVYSTAYKLKLAKKLIVKGTKAASAAAVKGGSMLKKAYDKHQVKKEAKKAAEKIIELTDYKEPHGKKK